MPACANRARNRTSAASRPAGIQRVSNFLASKEARKAVYIGETLNIVEEIGILRVVASNRGIYRGKL